MKVALIPCGVSEWRREGRLLGRVDLQHAPEADVEIAEWVARLRSTGLSKLFHAPDGLSKGAARRIGRELNIPVKSLDALDEVDLGLWAGLTDAELKKRYAKAHRQLIDSPLNVVPPSGEDFNEAANRVRGCLKKRIKPNGKTGVGLVMRPIAFTIAKQVLEGAEPSELWEASRAKADLLIMDTNGVPELATKV